MILPLTAQRQAMRPVLGMRPGILRAFTRRRPVHRGFFLDRHFALALKLSQVTRQPDIASLALPLARLQARNMSLALAGAGPTVARVEDVVAEFASGTRRRVRIYWPDLSDEARPAIVYYHGGGFVVCDLDSHDAFCRSLCLNAGAVVISVDYRLAPEHRFPTAADDALEAWKWARDRADEFGADASRMGTGGDSAGGTLAAVVAQRMLDEDPRLAPAFQLLLYPAVDNQHEGRLTEELQEGFGLTGRTIRWFVDQYATAEESVHPFASPLRRSDMSGLPPAVVITAGFDLLCDEGDAYADALRAGGVSVLHRRFDAMVHGFALCSGVPAAQDAMKEVYAMLRRVIE